MNKDNLNKMIELIDDKFLVQAIEKNNLGNVRSRRNVSICAAAFVIIIFAVVCGISLSRSNITVVTDSDNNTVTIPPVELDIPPKNAAIDVRGFIMYNGKFYEQGGYIDYSDCPDIKNLADKFIGTAKGDYGCYKRPKKIENYTSSVTGDIYTVKGYDSNYLICIPQMYDGCEFMAFFECLNGVSFNCGSDIFENKMHLKGNLSSLSYCYSDGFNDVKKIISPNPISPKTIDKFVDELYNADAVYEKQMKTSGEPILLYLNKNDGTEYLLLLYENGCVVHNHCCFKLKDTSAFDLIYNTCK